MYVGKLMCEILWDSCMYCLKKWHIVLGRGLLFAAPCRWAMALYHAILIARFQHPVHGARYKVCCVWSHLFVLVYLHFQYLNAIWLNMATRHVCFYLLCAMCLCMILLYKSINQSIKIAVEIKLRSVFWRFPCRGASTYADTHCLLCVSYRGAVTRRPRQTMLRLNDLSSSVVFSSSRRWETIDKRRCNKLTWESRCSCLACSIQLAVWAV